MIVPTATLLVAVMELEFPAVAVVLKLRIELPTVHVFEAVDGVTEASTHVVDTPV